MASQKLILLQDVEDLGLAGDEVNVAPGFARNFLLPRKLAMKSSPAALKVLAARKEKIEEQRKKEQENSKQLAAKIAETEVVIVMEAAEDNKLYGSVNSRVIGDALAEKGIQLDYHRIKLAENIRELGKFDIEVKLHSDVNATLKVSIVRA